MTMGGQQSKRYLAEEAYASTGKLNTRLHIQEHYGTGPVPWFQWVFERLRFPPEGRILDVGSGPGHVWWRNSQQLPAEIGFYLGDLSGGMVAAARDNLAGAAIRAFFLCMDGEWLPFASACFEAVVALGVVDHFPDHQQGLAELGRVLRPGGTLYVSGGGRTHLQEIEEVVAPFLPEIEYGGAHDRFGLENGVARLAPYFSQVERYMFEDTLCFHEVEPIVAYVRSEGEVAERLKGKLLAAFTADLEKRLADQGEIQVTRQKGLFVARKEGIAKERIS